MRRKHKNSASDEPKESKNLKDLKDLFLFAQVLSTALLIAGYVFLGVWLAGWLERKDFPRLLAVLAPPALALFGLWQGWLFLRQFWGKNRNGKK